MARKKSKDDNEDSMTQGEDSLPTQLPEKNTEKGLYLIFKSQASEFRKARGRSNERQEEGEPGTSSIP